MVVGQGVCLFLAAWTLAYWQAWLYLGLQLTTMMGTNLYLEKHHPDLLEGRLRLAEKGETERTQAIVIRLLRIASLALLVWAGLQHRLGTMGPAWLSVVGAVIYLAGVGLVVATMRANTYTASVIEVVPGQSVTRTGPYRLVRHPMYSGFFVIGLGTPLVLGAPIVELIVLPMLVLLAVRILAEERFLLEHLTGYREYSEDVHARLVPGVW
jgi:protein-S-isoprenylcysteine O-methyltransferase Ste14